MKCTRGESDSQTEEKKLERTLEEIKFEKYPIQGGRVLHVAKVPSDVRMDHPTTQRTLEIHGLEPVTYQIIISGIDYNKKLKEFTKGKWGWLAGQGLAIYGFKNWNANGELIKQTDKNPEKTVLVWPGNQPLSLYVHSDDGAAYFGARFVLGAGVRPDLAASVVFGLEKA